MKSNKTNAYGGIHVLSRAVIIDSGYILLCKTLDLHNNFYFLPGGHIEHGESAEKALLRELQEETGATCTITRFIGCFENGFPQGESSICHNHEYNLLFAASSPTLHAPNAIARCEDHIEVVWMPLNELDTIDFRPAAFKDLLPAWLGQDMRQAFHSQMRF